MNILKDNLSEYDCSPGKDKKETEICHQGGRRRKETLAKTRRREVGAVDRTMAGARE